MIFWAAVQDRRLKLLVLNIPLAYDYQFYNNFIHMFVCYTFKGIWILNRNILFSCIVSCYCAQSLTYVMCWSVSKVTRDMYTGFVVLFLSYYFFLILYYNLLCLFVHPYALVLVNFEQFWTYYNINSKKVLLLSCFMYLRDLFEAEQEDLIRDLQNLPRNATIRLEL